MHPAWTYTLRDVVGSFCGVAVFALAMVAPGYCVVRWSNVCGFRERGLREQMAWSVALSFGVGAVALVAMVWLTSIAIAGWMLVVLGVCGVWMFSRARVRLDFSRCEAMGCAVLAACWTALVVLSLVDIGSGAGLWMSVTAYDHSVRVALVRSVMQHGVPPVNPLYWPGHDVGLRYYYFWYVSCAVVAKLAHLSARQAFIASCAWPLAGVVAMLALCGRYVLDWRGAQLRKMVWVAVALMSVTGLDLLPTLLGWMAGGSPAGDMEWWSAEQVSSWADAMLWAPHHVAALVCGLLCLLLLWMASRESADRWKMAALAGVSFASAFGLSIYMALATAMLAGFWVVWRLLHRDRRCLLVVAMASVVAGVILLPYVVQLAHVESGSSAPGSPVLALGVREMLPDAMLTGAPGIRGLRLAHPAAATALARLILLAPGYFIELGFFGVVLVVLVARRKLLSEGERLLLGCSVTGLLIVTFLRSQVIATNDFGIRASLVPQFCLLLLGAAVLVKSTGTMRRVLLFFIVAGVAGSIYQVVMLRLYLPSHELRGDAAMKDLAESTYALRDGYAELDRRIPADARVQYDAQETPGTTRGYMQFAQMMNVPRQVLAGDGGCDAAFGGDAGACAAIQDGVRRLYAGGSGQGLSASAAVGICRMIGAQYLVVTRWDSVWDERGGWVWELPAVVERPDVRVVACEIGQR